MRRFVFIFALLLGVVFSTTREAQSAQTQSATPKNFFHIKYIAEGVVYLDAGRNAGLDEGMLLHLCHADPNGGTTEAVRFQGQEPIADVRIFSVADSSSAAEIINSREDLTVSDIAYLDVQSVHLREDMANTIESQNYPVVVSFSYGDPLDEEVRATTVSPKMAPIDNQVRGRIGWDFGTLSEPGGLNSRQAGFMVQADMSRLGGTHWNFSGYWRGRFNSQRTGRAGGATPSTINDLINRTYHLGLYYQNPDSAILFGGSTPDPTSWSYSLNQHIAGTFINYEKGDFDRHRLSSTFGLATTSIRWHVAREFAFLENMFSLGRGFSVYNSLQADKARTAIGGASYNTGVTQSFTSVRYQPITLLTFNLNHNYLRNLPTFDPALISTGLLDQYLFQGLSGGVRLEFPYRIAFSTDVGRSKNNTDKAPSWNQMYGLTFGEIRGTGLQLDLRHTKFNSSFGQGTYEFVSLSRSLTDRLHVQVQGGTQHLNSLLSTNSSSRFVTGTADWSIGPRYFVEGLYTWNTGTSMSYRQMNLTFGYRFGGFLRK